MANRPRVQRIADPTAIGRTRGDPTFDRSATDFLTPSVASATSVPHGEPKSITVNAPAATLRVGGQLAPSV